MAKLKTYIVLAIDPEDNEDSSVVLLKAKNEIDALKQYIVDYRGLYLDDEADMLMCRHLMDDNPLMIGEMAKIGVPVDFEQYFGDSLVAIGVDFENFKDDHDHN